MLTTVPTGRILVVLDWIRGVLSAHGPSRDDRATVYGACEDVLFEAVQQRVTGVGHGLVVYYSNEC